MAVRPVFLSDLEKNHYVSEVSINFEWFPGYSIKQKQQSINSLHTNFKEKFPNKKILEISSKSESELGKALSAFNLMIKTKNNKNFSVETAFQASKVFENGGPFMDLYEKSSKEAKKDNRLKNSGNLVCFNYYNRIFELEPKTFFYDWLYVNALHFNDELAKEVMEYDSFTDIEFNPQKSINCQARSVALFVALKKQGLLEEAIKSMENYKSIIFKNNIKLNNENTSKQLGFDDFLNINV